MLLSEWIRQQRERCGRSQKELAEQLEVNLSTVEHWESGRHAPGPYYRALLDVLFGKDTEERPERKPRMENEQSGTYFVPPVASQDETERLRIQADFIGRMQGGPLTEQPDPSVFRRVLDIGCGTGNWLIDLARDYPEMTELVGVDISQKRIDFATEQAKRAGVGDRVHFQVMDALRSLDFADDAFDLVNARFAMSFMRTWDWPKLLTEMGRVVRQGGTIRLVETLMQRANMPGFNQFWQFGIEAARQSGHLTADIESIGALFPRLLLEQSSYVPQVREIAATYRPGDPDFPLLVEDMRLLVAVSEAHLKKWLAVEGYRALVAQINRELADPGFELTWTLVTAWATK